MFGPNNNNNNTSKTTTTTATTVLLLRTIIIIIIIIARESSQYRIINSKNDSIRVEVCSGAFSTGKSEAKQSTINVQRLFGVLNIIRCCR